jgi:Reverse transcriptase (RNA-dependent DNA polymerase)
LRIKYNSDRIIERYKGWLVTKGYTQIYGIDYQLDVKNTFLQGILKEEVYMTIPFGHKEEWNTNFICKLKKINLQVKIISKSLVWKIEFLFIFCRFMASKVDSSLFINLYKHNITIFLVYVHDLIITGNNLDKIRGVKK